jgi:DNA-binding winged helix-turn-helix (wHTH) protein
MKKSMDKKESRLYEFDLFCLDASERVLLYDMQEVPMTPKVFETLLLLVENSGHVVGKEELLKTIWPDSIVEESSLSQNIFHLRKALGDGSDGRRFIETIPKRGYKFIAPVKVVTNKPAAVDGLPHHSITVDAYQLYSMGLYFCNKGTPEGLSKGVEYLRQATEKDPNYALAFALLAGTYVAIAGNRYDFMKRGYSLADLLK